MKQIIQYKRCVAFATLLIQLFVSTPVQFYHHHDYANDDIKHAATVSEICPICNHQYTAYYNDDVVVDIIFLKPQFEASYTVLQQDLITITCLSLSNKSPPLS